MGRDYRVRAGQPLIKHLQQLQDKLAAVERDMSLLKSRLRSPTHPIYDPSFPLDAVDGQFALQGGVPHYYWGGAWHPFASGGGEDSIHLWSQNAGYGSNDGTSTHIPAYTGFGGFSGSLAFNHKFETSAFYTALHYHGPVVVAPPFDTVVVGPGLYDVKTWCQAWRPGASQWIGFELATEVLTGGGSFTDPNPADYWIESKLVDGTIANNLSNPQAPGNVAQFNRSISLYVPAGEKANIYIGLFHFVNAAFDVDDNWFLSITKKA